jgi:exonuclease SbcD
MKLLHTADWHLGAKLGGHDLTPALLQQIEYLCALCDERKVDVLLVAGDVFEKKYGLADSTKKLAQMLRPRVQDGLHVVLVPGNHDDREHFRMMRELLSLTHDDTLARRVKIVEGNEIFSLCGTHFCAMPYPNREMLLQSQADIQGDERWTWSSAAYADVVRAWGARLKEKAAQAREPMVFVAHVTVAGVATPSGHEINYNEAIRLGRNDLPTDMGYIALGHIHQKQKIEVTSPCYYAGSLDRLDMGECEDNKFALLVDVPELGAASVEEIPLSVTPFLKLSVKASQLETLLETQPEIADAFAYFEVDPEAEDKVAVRRRINELCPRALDVRITGDDTLPQLSGAPAQPRDFRATALDYVRERFGDDPDLPGLETETQKLMDEVGGMLRDETFETQEATYAVAAR